ncbi:RNA polymerase I-specific transcription initiation factor RRN3 homolog Tif-IA [Rhynchophorus ferrugineus]|uniref:RNA polymerase I-specific transcription initiation factor RRN3 n=1 Tax=Rhynchophorus ferrugineus TaxID=354439 RepID=A0A834M5S0_RHYFE|nr:hypothetical protein GWI33_018951 [Rhynchophorus ferrugineus]
MSLKSGRSRSSTGTPSILKKNSTLKKRLSELVNASPKVRFQLPHAKKVQTILSEYIQTNDPKQYLSLVCFIRDAELPDKDISDLLVEATECISLLNQDLRLFVEALLSVRWTDRNETVVTEYQSFIVNLLSAHNYHTKIVIDSLVSQFLPGQTRVNGQLSQVITTNYVELHKLINILLKVVPMSKDFLRQSIIKYYPYYNKPLIFQQSYLKNLLSIIRYQPSFRPDILHLIFSKLVIMDVNAPKEIIEQKMEDEDMFPMDDIKSVKTIQTTYTLVDRGELGTSLDTCMDMVLDYILEECNDDQGNLDWSKTKNLYRDLVSVFDKVVLPTYGTHHVQFIMFVLCSLKPALTEAFLNHLWRNVCDLNVPVVLRQAAVSYVASLVARALFVPLSMLKGTLQQMAEWIHSYAAHQDGLDSVNTDVRVHLVFYSVCQSLFYIVAFRHKDLVASRKDVAFLQSLQLGKMVTGRLNPLRVCQPAVVKNFAAVTRQYQLAYCYTVIDHNERNNLPTIHQDGKGARLISDNLLTDFFPFDPYILEQSSRKVQPHYRDYHEEMWSHSSEVDHKENQEDDDFLDNSHEFTSTNARNKFSYGSSPGFKFKA